MTMVFYTKKAKAEIRRRKKRKATSDGDGETSQSADGADDVNNGRNKQMNATKHDNSTEEPVAKKAKITKHNPLKVIIPPDLTPKEAKKFRKDERRKARSNGVTDEDAIKFIIEGQPEESGKRDDGGDRDDKHTKKKPKKEFPRINDLLTQHATQQKLDSLAAKRKSLHDALPTEEKQKYIAIDCEMVGVGTDGVKSALARVSVVDWDGNVLLDTFVRVSERVTDFRTHVSGVRPKDISVKNTNAMEHSEVRQQVETLLLNKILVGHALKNDLSALLISHPKQDTRDTAKYKPFMRPSGRSGGKLRPRKLRDLVYEQCGRVIQVEGESHCSVDDARASMELFKAVKERWEKELEGGGGRKMKGRGRK